MNKENIKLILALILTNVIMLGFIVKIAFDVNSNKEALFWVEYNTELILQEMR